MQRNKHHGNKPRGQSGSQDVDKMSRLVTLIFTACKMRGDSPSGNKASSETQEEVQGAIMRNINASSGRYQSI